MSPAQRAAFSTLVSPPPPPPPPPPPVVTPEPVVQEAPESASTAPVPVSSREAVWDRLAQCEAGGNWNINTGNGYSGGLQFVASTWISAGGGQYASAAHLASREQQIAVGEHIVASSGGTFRAWPGCRAKLGLV